MKLFSTLYTWTMAWSKHRHAPFYLYGLSFLESSVFPIPPDVMLAPMALANPKRAWMYAALTTLASILGGLLGYLLGKFCFAFIHPYLIEWGYEATYLQILGWFEVWGFWIVLMAGFSPIPYKLFTIAAGAVGMPLIPFILGSLLGRGGRFFLVAGLMYWGGARMEKILMRYLDRLGWLLCLVLLAIYSTMHIPQWYDQWQARRVVQNQQL